MEVNRQMYGSPFEKQGRWVWWAPSPPLRPHLGQHSPAGVNRLWSPGQARGGQGRALQDTLPLEQTHTVQGEGLHWLSCCGYQRNRETDSHTQKYNQLGRKERMKQRDSRAEGSCFTLWGRENFVRLSLSDRQENRVTGGGGRKYGKLRDHEKSGGEKKRLKSKGVYVNVDNEARCESTLPEHVNTEMQSLLG